MRVRARRPDFRSIYGELLSDTGAILVDAMDEAQQGLKEELRDQVRGAGLGERVAKAWQGRTYPQGKRSSIDPAAYVWTKAAKIVDAFDRGASIYPTGGRRYLALPTKNVPRKLGAGAGRSGLMTPLDVETAFNQDLIVRRGSGGRLLAFVNAVPSANRRGFRPATAGRLAKGRTAQLVLMFVLVPSVKLPKLLDLQAAANAWADRVPGLIDKHWR